MSADQIKDIGKLFRDVKPIQEALRVAVIDALRRHKLAGNAIAEWRDGRVVWIPAEEIRIPGE